ncbi:YybS family protein [Metabacillus sp. GX 13764]|uniref:YybS family protein n=1 Tax=Metabacillus kandeliae TaxID=2900151 RepID=UPI001E5469A6|nr:YybS family protein [Metabacillus kandeliae]MCD7035299.1 YybS family protein [Metabacillus kandeliae]
MKRANSTVEGAMLLALFAVLALMMAYIPLIGGIALFIVPIIFMVYILRHPLKQALLFFFASILLTVVIGQFALLPVTITFSLSGFVMGYFYGKKKTGSAIASGGVVFLIGTVITYLIYAFVLGLLPSGDPGTWADQAIQQAKMTWEQFGLELSDKQISQFKDMVMTMVYTLPASLALSSAFFTLITHLIGSAVLKRLKMGPSPLLPFREWKLPQSIVWYYFIVIVLGMLQLEKGGFPYLAVMNLTVILQLLLTIQGLSFIYYYFHKKGLSIGFPVALTVFSLFVPILLQLVRILGIIDLGFNLRARIQNSSK